MTDDTETWLTVEEAARSCDPRFGSFTAGPPNAEAAHIVQLFVAGLDAAEIVREEYGVGGGRGYKLARASVQATIRQALAEVRR